MRRREVLVGLAISAVGRIRTADSRAARRGLWRVGGSGFAIGAFPEFGGGLFAFDYRTSRVTPAAEGAAQAGNRADPIDVDRTPFDVPGTGATIKAEVATPRHARRGASMLMIYGSGPAPREALDLWAFWFLHAGFSVISYDKRGSGRSTGDWRLASLETLAEDAKMVIAGARARGLAGRLYAWGASQAGWIMPQLGGAGLVDGFVMHAGSAKKPADQILEQVEAELRAYGFDPDEIERARNYYALDIDVSRGRRRWGAVSDAYAEASSRGAEWLLAPPAAAGAPEREMIRLMADFDPAPHWSANAAPVLALFGGKDWIVPAEGNRTALAAMARPGTVESLVLAEANHLMFVAGTGLREEYRSLSQLHPDYFPAIERWLDRHVQG